MSFLADTRTHRLWIWPRGGVICLNITICVVFFSPNLNAYLQFQKKCFWFSLLFPVFIHFSWPIENVAPDAVNKLNSALHPNDFLHPFGLTCFAILATKWANFLSRRFTLFNYKLPIIFNHFARYKSHQLKMVTVAVNSNEKRNRLSKSELRA